MNKHRKYLSRKIKPRSFTKKAVIGFLTFVIACICTSTVVVAAGGEEVIEPMTKFTDFLFAIFRIIGIAITGYGIFEFATAVRSHDGAQKVTAAASIASGLIIIFIKEILQLIGIDV